MLRPMILACLLAAAAAPALAEPAQQPTGMVIRSEQDGSVQGRVADVRRDGEGHIVSISARGLEPPADAPPYVMAPRRGGPTIVNQDSGFRIAAARPVAAPAR